MSFKGSFVPIILFTATVIILIIIQLLMVFGVIDPTTSERDKLREELKQLSITTENVTNRTHTLSDDILSINDEMKNMVIDRTTLVDLKSEPKDTFYPCKIQRLGNAAIPMSFWVCRRNRANDSDDYNNCTVGGMVTSAGLTDVRPQWHDIYVANWDEEEKLYYGLFRGNRDPGCVIYLRGGYEYEVQTNHVVNLFKNGIDGQLDSNGDLRDNYPILTENTSEDGSTTYTDADLIKARMVLDLIDADSGHYTYGPVPVN